MAKHTTPSTEDEPTIVPGIPIESAPDQRKQIDAVRLNTGKRLALQPKRKIRIPLPGGGASKEKGDKPPAVVVGINGYNYLIRKGETVEVPESVALVLEQAEII